MPQLERVILLFRHLYKSNPMKKDERCQIHIEVLDQLSLCRISRVQDIRLCLWNNNIKREYYNSWKCQYYGLNLKSALGFS